MPRANFEITPAGVVAFPHLYRADDKYCKKPEDAKFKINLLIHKADKEAAAFIKDYQDHHERLGGEYKMSSVKDGDLPTGRGENKGVNEEFKDHWKVVITSKYKPNCVDTQGTLLPPSVTINAGDLVKVAVNRYEPPAGGASLQMSAVMLMDKRSVGQGQAAISAFGAQEGYVAPVPTDDEPQADEGQAEQRDMGSRTGDF